MKNASLSSRPESWHVTESGFENPTFSGRVGFRPNEAWNFGLSASEGPYFRREAEATLPPGRGIGDYREFVLGQDASFAWHHLQVWAEFYEARFEVPRVGNADTFAYYVEAKYKFTPQLFGAMRWNQQLFSNVNDHSGGRVRWSQDLARIDVAAGYRFTSHTQLKLQYSFQQRNHWPTQRQPHAGSAIHNAFLSILPLNSLCTFLLLKMKFIGAANCFGADRGRARPG